VNSVASAQSITGSLLGTVSDPSGAPISGAQSDTPGEAGGLMSWAASKAVGVLSRSRSAIQCMQQSADPLPERRQKYSGSPQAQTNSDRALAKPPTPPRYELSRQRDLQVPHSRPRFCHRVQV
jgi:hypothetical protein